MKYIQTLWTRDVEEKDVLSISAGWRVPEYHWMSWALSCLQLHKIFGQVDLVTDTNGKYVLSTLFQLPYNNITTLLNDDMQWCPPDAWAMAKMYAYKSQTVPFLHFDSDFYLWHALDNGILNAQVVTQNLEKDLPFYKRALEDINKHFTYIPAYCQPSYYNHQSIYACNAGIFGGNNLAFIQAYCKFAIDFVQANKHCFAFEQAANVNFVFEQYFLYCTSKEKNVPITFLSNVIQDNPVYSNYVHFNDAPLVPFIHPVGGYKKNIEICDHIARKLRMEYPEYYNRITEVLQKEKKLRTIKTYFLGAQLQYNSNVFFEDKYAIYKRTMAALQYLQKNMQRAGGNAVQMLENTLLQQDKVAFKRVLLETGISQKHTQLVLELYALELKKADLYAKTFINNTRQKQLYQRDVEQYKLAQVDFANTINNIEQLVVVQSPRLVLVSICRNWICKIPELTGEMIKDKFSGEEDQRAKMALVPNVLRREVEEYYLEPIDIIVVNLCRQKKSILSLMHDMEACFSEEELQSNYDGFRQLIVNTVKRLIYLGIINLQNTGATKI